MKVLIVKLSSLGDVVHTMPAVQDLRRLLPNAQIDWVVEEGFAELAALCEGVHRVIPFSLRRWRKQGLISAKSRAEWDKFKLDLQRDAYDYVFDFQGLIKSATIAQLARLTKNGQRIGLANRTEGASYEPLARLAYTRAIRIVPHTHAIERSRQLVASALDKPIYSHLSFGFAIINNDKSVNTNDSITDKLVNTSRLAIFVHGTSRADKLWREASWVRLGQALVARGYRIALPWGSEAERLAAERIAQGINVVSANTACVLNKMGLSALTRVVASSELVVGVDSGLVHIASGLNISTVQLYNFPTSWRTGGYWSERIVNVEDTNTPGGPTEDAVLTAVRSVTKGGA
jgi:heptosyltransferase-1